MADSLATAAAGIRSIAIVTADAGTLINFRGHLMDALLKHGIAVHYVGPPVDETTRRWLDERSIRSHEISLGRNILSPLADVATFFQIWSALRRGAPDAIVTYMIKSTVYGLFAAAVARVPNRFVLITGLGYAFSEQAGDWRWRIVNRVARVLYALSLRFASGVAFQNIDDERDFRQWKLLRAAVPSTVVDGSGVDTSHFRPVSLPAGPQCLMMARLVKDKGVLEFIEAARIVRAARPAARFFLLGAEETNPAAVPVEVVRAAEAEGVITYLGSAADVRPHIAAARIFVLPSYYREGTPRSILEAMAMGRPIVTTDVPGCRETVVPGRNGLLVPGRDARSLADAIIALIDDPERTAAMGRESRLIAEQRYEVGKVTSHLLGFFCRVARSSDG